MAAHLIKRREADFDLKNGWRCETSIKKWPNGIKVKPKDIIYVAQNGYAIFGKGIVKTVLKYEFNSLEDFIFHALHKSCVKDDSYWLSKIKEYSKNLPTPKIKLLEYELVDTECFDYIIPLEKKYLKQSSWYYLNEDTKFIVSKVQSTLTLHIPSKIRVSVYHKFKIISKNHIIDIDHFVPKSIGGPGNIIENLIPISASINRNKFLTPINH